ncbi:MAG: prolyl oligopeptidase family serine peptidase [Chlorobiota bacterium]
MKLISIIIMTIITSSIASGNDMTNYEPPKTKIESVYDTLHGDIVKDDYRWLEDKDNPKVKEWSKKQHKSTVDYIINNGKDIPGLKDELKQLKDRDYRSAPFFIGEREFFWARKKGEQHNTLYTIIDGDERRLFSPIDLDDSGNTSLAGLDYTEDGNIAAIGTQFKGDEIRTYRLLNTKTGDLFGDDITGLRSFSFAKNEDYAYITVRTREMIDKQEPIRVYKHKIGTDRKNDVLLDTPNDSKDIASVWDSKHGRLTFFSKGDFYSNTLRVRSQDSNEEPKVIYESEKYESYPTVKNNKIYFKSNHKAPNFKIYVTDIDKPEFENWKEFYPEKETVLQSFVITTDHILVLYKKDVLKRIAVYDFEGNYVKELEAPEFGDISGISYNEDMNTVFVGLTTFTSPTKLYKLDGKTLDWEFYYQDELPVDTDNIKSELVFYTSKDGTKVPLFLSYRKDIELDGTNPTLLYGYGGFNISMGPSFLGDKASFINRGGVYAVAGLRGGSEYGENWHLDGMLDKKQNVFDDFISAAEYLIEEKFTSSEKLCIMGGSNGGLLTGACLVQRPELFKSAIVAVPLLDMLRYHKFLIARYWIPEYGDPDKKEDYAYIKEYSPYQNIKPGVNYPITLVKAGENDTRVDPLHAKKFAAALQNNPGQKNDVFLFVDFDSGHGSGQSIEKQIENSYLQWKFIFNSLGM